MSWNINMVGAPADVKAATAADTYLPQPLKDAIALFADAFDKLPVKTALHVSSFGHYDQNWGGNIGKFEIAQVALAPPAPAAPAPAQEPATPPLGGWPQDTMQPTPPPA